MPSEQPSLTSDRSCRTGGAHLRRVEYGRLRQELAQAAERVVVEQVQVMIGAAHCVAQERLSVVRVPALTPHDERNGVRHPYQYTARVRTHQSFMFHRFF